jgi:hypothetical protein
MSTPSPLRQLAQRFAAALGGDFDALAGLLADDATLRLYRWDGLEGYRPRQRILDRLKSEWAAWPDARLETLTVMADDNRATVELRIQATDPAFGRLVDHYRTALLQVVEDKVAVIDYYCAEPVPAAKRGDWVAPAGLSPLALVDLFANERFAFELREPFPPNFSGLFNLRENAGGSGGAHPGSNGVGDVRWSEAEADARIEAYIEWHRQRGSGFTWHVSPYDRPTDLRERLERHGLALAGEHVKMARLGLDDLDIPTNPEATVERVTGEDEAAIDALLRIMAVGFHWTPEQVAERRPGVAQRLRQPVIQAYSFTYLARLGGAPVGYAHMSLRAGVAHLGGAATLPEYRGRRIYPTLLRRRLEDARARGYHLAVIEAGPMSQPVVARYGFQDYGRNAIYGWMPVMDRDVIRSLVPQE